MKLPADTLKRFFTKLGFSPEEAKIYLILTERGTLTTLELSRASGISRTQIYRIVEKMKAKGVVEEIVDEHRIMTKAIDVTELKRLVVEQRQAVESLESLFPQVIELLQTHIGQGQPQTKVQFYRGKAGLRQMVWHTLRAQKEIVGYTYRNIEEYVGYAFMQDWRDAFIRKGNVLRDIYSDRYLESKKQIKQLINYPEEHFPSRYISSKILDINLQTDFYNDVSAIYNWHEGEVFGVEIYNSKISQFHKQLFEIIWKMAEK